MAGIGRDDLTTSCGAVLDVCKVQERVVPIIVGSNVSPTASTRVIFHVAFQVLPEASILSMRLGAVVEHIVGGDSFPTHGILEKVDAPIIER